jgi:L-amino acid N-acyltransferase YncA
VTSDKGAAADRARLDIYRPYVENTAISFELVAPTVAEFAARIVKVTSGWVRPVAEVNSRCIGYAYASAHRERPAYRWSVETTAYVHSDFHRKGIGRALYLNILSALTESGFRNAFAGVSLPKCEQGSPSRGCRL